MSKQIRPEVFFEWAFYYKINEEKVKRNTGNWQGFGEVFVCLVGFEFDFFNGKKSYDWKENQVSSHILDYLPVLGCFFLFLCKPVGITTNVPFLYSAWYILEAIVNNI